ncbi:MAG: hypothetical protein UY76_C0030G0002 [Candidatus Uhrbacteria bacterium GW2011_GWA2_52_8d]|uniref:Uncharacterized protein n=2 Tax=Candidatus Uhriibacteriota TaxID=1752732 RepID=A0A0G0WRK0_9BACT|nr:MAG: hypothetical protein UU35_C0006G0038 [Candidatus Uhrbacteria bacterium GW2011_GWC2_41_11]KKW32384.1 MAG: hypothetical protein UY76_C0030G0002 [Candidatus Uhrbacteria bacterium GW2011_GWA2_52_8d]HBP00474.1 hypothetical protein [Candidatus Uhrbacteria bacterium]
MREAIQSVLYFSECSELLESVLEEVNQGKEVYLLALFESHICLVCVCGFNTLPMDTEKYQTMPILFEDGRVGGFLSRIEIHGILSLKQTELYLERVGHRIQRLRPNSAVLLLEPEDLRNLVEPLFEELAEAA